MGRPRAFCAETALDRALEVFWRKGYEATSLSDLTEAMGINRPSLYGTFGNKEELFRQALERYVRGKEAHLREALDAPTGRAAVERLLLDAAAALTDPEHPAGCMAVQGALTCNEASDCLRQQLDGYRVAQERIVRERLERASDAGELPPGTDPAALARLVTTLIHGMSVQAAGGATRSDLEAIVHAALLFWPP